MAYNLSMQLRAAGITGLDKIEQRLKKISNITLKVDGKVDISSIHNQLKKGGPYYIDVTPRVKSINNQLNKTVTRTVNVVEKIQRVNRPTVNPDLKKVEKELAAIEKKYTSLNQTISGAAETIEEFGARTAISAKRFAAFTIGTVSILAVTSALKNAVSQAIEFEREISKIAQVTEISLKGVSGIRKEILGLSSSLGVSSEELAVSASTLAQTGVGLSAVEKSLKAIALARLSPSFGNAKETIEGLIAVQNQFGKSAGDAFEIFSKINAVSKAYPVESQDLISAVQKSGGAFKQAGGSFEQFLGVITSIRSTTRESADAIATGVRTIIARIQRPKTLDFLEDVLGISLRDPIDSSKTLPIFDLIDKIRTSIKSQGLLPKEGEGPQLKLSQITEEIGGTRQLSRVIPLLFNFDKAIQASNLAIESSDSLTKDAAIAQETLANKLQKTTEELKKFGDALLQNENFNKFATILLNIASAAAKVGTALLPLTNLFSVFALANLTNIIPKFTQGISRVKVTTAANGGYMGGSKISGHSTFNLGGRDTVPAFLKPGEVVLNETQQRRISGVSGLSRNSFFGALGVPGFAGGGEIQGGLFGPKVAQRARYHANKGNLYAYDSGQEGYYKVNPDGSIIPKLIDYRKLPEGAKTISNQPYSEQYESQQIKGANLLPIKDPGVTKLDEIGLSTIAPSFKLDPILKGLQGIGALTPKALAKQLKRRSNIPLLIKTAFGDNDVQGLGVYGRGKDPLNEGHLAEVIDEFTSGRGSGFFAQAKVPGPYYSELRVHVAVDQNGRVKILPNATVNKNSRYDPTNKKSVDRFVQGGIEEDVAFKIASSYKKSAQLTAFNTIKELVAKKGIKNATFGVDIGATQLDYAKKIGVNSKEFYNPTNIRTGTIAFETNPSEESGSSGFFGGYATEDLVKKVFGSQDTRKPAKDRDRILELMSERIQGPLPLFGPPRPILPETINDNDIQDILFNGLNPLDHAKQFDSAFQEGSIAGLESLKDQEKLYNQTVDYVTDKVVKSKKKLTDLSPIAGFLKRFNAKKNPLEQQQNARFKELSGYDYEAARKKFGFAGGGLIGDVIPAMLSRGEVVLNGAQQKALGGLVGTSPRKLFNSIGVPQGRGSGKYAGGIDLGSGAGSVGSTSSGIGLIGISLLANTFTDLQGPLKDVSDLVTGFGGTLLILNSTLSQSKNLVKYREDLAEVNKVFDKGSEEFGFFANKVKELESSIAENSLTKDVARGQAKKAGQNIQQIGIQKTALLNQAGGYDPNDLRILNAKEAAERRRLKTAQESFALSKAELQNATKLNAEYSKQAQAQGKIVSAARDQQSEIAKKIAGEDSANKKIQIGVLALQTASILTEKISKGALEKRSNSFAGASALQGAFSGASTLATLGGTYFGPKGALIGGAVGAIGGAGLGFIKGKETLTNERRSAIQNVVDTSLSGQSVSNNELAQFNKDISELAKTTKTTSGSFTRLYDFTEALGGAFSESTAVDYSLTKGIRQLGSTIFDFWASVYNAIPLSDKLSDGFSSAYKGITDYVNSLPVVGEFSRLFTGESGGSLENLQLARKQKAVLFSQGQGIDTKEKAEQFLNRNSSQVENIAKLQNTDVETIRKKFVEDLVNPTVNLAATISKAKDQIFISLENMNNFFGQIDEAFNQSQVFSGQIGAINGNTRVIDRSATLRNVGRVSNQGQFDSQLDQATSFFGDYGKEINQTAKLASSVAPDLRKFISDIKNDTTSDRPTGTDILTKFQTQFKSRLKGSDQLYAALEKSLIDSLGIAGNADENVNIAAIDLRSATQTFVDSVVDSTGQIAERMSKAAIEAQNQLGEALRGVNQLRSQATSKNFERFDLLDQRVGFNEQILGRPDFAARSNIEQGRLSVFGSRNPGQLGVDLTNSQNRVRGIQAALDTGNFDQNQRQALLLAQSQEIQNIENINKQFDLLEDATARLSITQLKLNQAQQEQGTRKSIADIDNFGSFAERQKLNQTRSNLQEIEAGRLNIGDLTGERARSVIDLLRQGGEGQTGRTIGGVNFRNPGLTGNQRADQLSQQADFQRRIREGATPQQAAALANDVYGRPQDQQLLQRQGNQILNDADAAKAVRAGNIGQQANQQEQLAIAQYQALFNDFSKQLPLITTNMNQAAATQLAAANTMKDVSEKLGKDVLNGEVELAGQVNLNVNVNGAQVLADLTPQINNLVQTKIKDALNDFISKKMPQVGRV